LNGAHYYSSLLKHYGSATLIDVLHSPFVFGLYNNCIRKNSLQQLPGQIPKVSRVNDVLLKYILKYKPAKIYLPGHASGNDFADALHTLNIPFDKKQPFHACDLIYFERVPDAAKIKDSIQHLHNDSVVVVNGMYRSKKQTQAWEAIKMLPEITVTVDLFFVGFVFIRSEQRKQNFRLRLF
jgi:hypothetical protein